MTKTRDRAVCRLPALLLAGALLAPLPGALSQAQEEAPPPSEQVLYALRDVSLAFETIQIRTVLVTDAGGSALVQLADGTLVEVRLVATQTGWSVREVALIAGSSESFYAWSQPWRNRVAAAESFLASATATGLATRRAEELAPLSWFEDPDEASRLWGMNPVTYRLMQTLQMMPVLGGPTGGGSLTNPVPRRRDQ